jgi:hypothetical protein
LKFGQKGKSFTFIPSTFLKGFLMFEVGSYGFSNFKVDKILCTLEIFGKIKLVAAHLLQLSVASTLYTSLLHHLAAALHVCHTALRYFPPPNLIFLLLVVSSHFSSPPARQAGRAKPLLLLVQLTLLCCRCRFALLLRCLLAAAAAAALLLVVLLACCYATTCLMPVLLLCYLLAAAAGKPEPPLPFQAAVVGSQGRAPTPAEQWPLHRPSPPPFFIEPRQSAANATSFLPWSSTVQLSSPSCMPATSPRVAAVTTHELPTSANL